MDFDLTSITTLIDATGFPIGVSCILFYIVNTTLKELRTTLGELKQIVQNNSDVIESLKQEHKEHDV